VPPCDTEALPDKLLKSGYAFSTEIIPEFSETFVTNLFACVVSLYDKLSNNLRV